MLATAALGLVQKGVLGALATVNSDGSSWGGGTDGAVIATRFWVGACWCTVVPLVCAASVQFFIGEVIVQKDGSGVLVQKDGSGVLVQKDGSSEGGCN